MTTHRFVPELPDLIAPEEYAADPDGRRVRFRIDMSGDGVEILGDAVRATELERLIEALGVEVVEQMLCG